MIDYDTTLEIYTRGYQAIGACDISNFLALCELAPQVQKQRDDLLAACKQMLKAVEGSYAQVRVAIGVMKQAVAKAEEVPA